MAPLSAGTGRGAVRGFGLKLQQSSSSAAWLQKKPSGLTDVHLLHSPLTTRLPPGLFCPVVPGKVWRVDRMVDEGDAGLWRSWRLTSLLPPVFVTLSFLLKTSPLAFTCVRPCAAGLLCVLQQTQQSLMSGSVSGLSRLSLCLIHGCWSWLAGRRSLLVADTETGCEVEREVTQVMISKCLLCFRMLGHFKWSIHRNYKRKLLSHLP